MAVNRELQHLARKHTERALKRIAQIAFNDDVPEVTQLAACKELLDRGYGKPAQSIVGDDELPPVRMKIERVIIDPDRDA